MMFNLIKLFAILLISLFFLNFSGPCFCNKNVCNSTPHVKTRTIYFTLKDSITGNDILLFPGGSLIVPDSIKLKDLRLGFFYNLRVGSGGNKSILYASYTRPAGVIDSLVFFFGNSVPDTLIVQTGLVDGWRGDECALIKDAGITKVTLRNLVLVETALDDAIIPLRK